MIMPKIGDKIYVGSSFYISHGEDDVVGGIATISKVDEKRYLDSQGRGVIFVSVKEHPGNSYNWNYLLEHQEEWKEQFGDNIAYPDPDYNDYGERW